MTASVVVTWRPRRLVPVVHCGRCRQRMPEDHKIHRSFYEPTHNDEAAPDAPGTAPDPHEGDHS